MRGYGSSQLWGTERYSRLLFPSGEHVCQILLDRVPGRWHELSEGSAGMLKLVYPNNGQPMKG